MHIRERHILSILLKRNKIFPVLGIIGPRQVGKTTFLMNQWRNLVSAEYLTLDKLEVAARARKAPEQFLLSHRMSGVKQIIVDEVQKVPHLFDSIKALVDESPGVGLYTVSGSVDFSAKVGIRESLGGRMATTRLYPMTLREIARKKLCAPWVKLQFKNGPEPLTSASINTWLERGGMPPFLRIGSSTERDLAVRAWLEAICYRDLQQFQRRQFDGNLAITLLKMMVFRDNFSMSGLGRQLGVSGTTVAKYLDAFEALFILHRLPLFEGAQAQAQFRFFDAGVVWALSNYSDDPAVERARIISLVLNEILAQYEYSGLPRPEITHYRQRGGAEVDIVLRTPNQLVAIDCCNTVDISSYRQRSIKSFLAKYPKAQGLIVAPITESFRITERLTAIPWTSVG
jgi:predicted AAA+ superfamily ATPase